MALDGKVAIVTGGGQGIGRGIAEALARQGAHVAILDLNREKAAETAEICGGLSGTALALEADVTDLAAVSRAVEQVEADLGPVGVLVNNAGVIRDRTLLKMSEEDWDFVVQTNLKSCFVCSKAVVPGMKERKWGRIINISSRAWLGGFGQANYSASKGGIVSLTRTLAIELGRYQITVNAIAPGVIDTPMYQSFSDEVKESLVKKQPTGKVGTPGDVGHAVTFFASPESSFITGQLLYVCGGKSLFSA